MKFKNSFEIQKFFEIQKIPLFICLSCSWADLHNDETYWGYETGRDMSDKEIGQSLVQSLANLRSMNMDRSIDTKPKKRSLDIVTAEDCFGMMAVQLSIPDSVERPKKCKLC